MVIRYSGKSAPSARKIAAEDDDITLVRHGYSGDINWGRERANTILNPDISNVTNKRVMRELFFKYNVPIPGPVGIESALHNLSWPIIGRPDKHMKGRGFWLCKNVRDVRRALRGSRRKKAATHFMEYIDNIEHEYRVHIFKGKSIRISEKAYEDENVPMYRKTYTTIKPTGPVKEVRKAAKKAMEAVGLDFGAVDVIVDADEKVYVLEVNAAPGIGGSLPRLYAKVFKEWYEQN